MKTCSAGTDSRTLCAFAGRHLGRTVGQIDEGSVPQILEEIVEMVSLTSATADRPAIVVCLFHR